MRNKFLYFLIICFLISTSISLAQCPNPSYSLPDTVCPNKPITISNSSNAISYNWDNGLGDLDSVPTGQSVANVTGLNYPSSLIIVNENDQYFGFIVNTGSNYLTRLDFGNSLNNQPNLINLPSNALLSTGATSLASVKEGNKWLVFITMNNPNSIVKVELDSINQNSNLNYSSLNISGLNNPSTIKLINHYGIISNASDANLIVLDFNGNYNNNPTTPNIASTGIPANSSFDLAFDQANCSYSAFVSSYPYGTVTKVDYGNSLLNTPTKSIILTGLYTSTGIKVEKENNKWHLFILYNNGIANYDFGTSLNNIPSLLYFSNCNSVLTSPQNLEVIKVNSNWIGITVNYYQWTVARLNFPDGNTTNNLYSNDETPSTIFFDASKLGYQRIELREKYDNGLNAIYLDSVFVNIAPPSAFFTANNLCLNDSVEFTDASDICYGNIVNWNWDFGDGTFSTDQNPKHVFTTSGFHSIILSITDNFNQTSNHTENLIIHIKPQADFNFTNNACSESPITLIDSTISIDGNIAQWNWNLNGNSITNNQVIYNFQNSGTYPVSLQVTSDFGCVDSITKNIIINPSPNADFTVFNSCIGETATFLNQTDSNSISSVTYQWSFGNNTSSNLTSPNYQYPNTPSIYAVQLIANATNGCADTIQKPIRIGNKPQPWFSISADTVCQNAEVIFTDSSFAGLGDVITSRKWDLGDGTILYDSISNTHFYTNPGLYQITLTVKSPSDCDSTIVRNLFVIASPNANYSISDVCFGLSNNFVDLSSSPNGSVITNWTLNFGDSTQTNNPNTSHAYNNYGSYLTSLIVTSDKGCSDTTFINAIVHPLPISNFGFDKSCTNQATHFFDSSQVVNGFINSWKWSFGNGIGTSTIQNPTFSFSNNFAYPVELICLTSFGCSDTTTKYVIVEKTPEFAVLVNDVCIGIANQFSYTLNSSGSSNLAFLWSFGDSTSSFQPSPTHLYTNAGTYYSSLEITDLTNGCADTKFDSLTIHPNPNADFINIDGCVNKDISLMDTSTISNDIIQNYFWNINGNQLFTGKQITYNSNLAGPSNVQLLVTSDFGCKDSISKTITIYPNPIVAFTSSAIYGAPPLNINFSNQSSAGNYEWDFGDNTTNSLLANPNHTFSDTGNYVIQLIVVSPYGCIDSSSLNINVFEPIIDLAIINNSITKRNGRWVLKALLRNNGNLPIQDAEIKLNLENRSLFYESITNLNLLPGNFIEHEFTSSFDAGDYTPSYFCTEILTANNIQDFNESNNSFCSTFNNKFDCFNLYPNPATSFVSFGITIPEDNDITIQLFSETGDECIKSIVTTINKGYNNYNFNTNELASGVYLIKINYLDEFKTIKFIRE